MMELKRSYEEAFKRKPIQYVEVDVTSEKKVTLTELIEIFKRVFP